MNTNTVHRVRRAMPADAEQLAHLRWDFRASMGTPVEAEDEFVVRCADWMRLHLADDARWRAYLLDHHGTAAGAVWLQLVEKIPNPLVEPEMHGYLTNFFIRAGHRNSGAGSAMLAALLADCEAIGVDSIFLWPTDRSRSLYERHGFAARNSVLVRDGR
jgi:GNAT superfamily N-acetyltransferase